MIFWRRGTVKTISLADKPGERPTFPTESPGVSLTGGITCGSNKKNRPVSRHCQAPLTGRSLKPGHLWSKTNAVSFDGPWVARQSRDANGHTGDRENTLWRPFSDYPYLFWDVSEFDPRGARGGDRQSSLNRVANDRQLTPSQETVVPGFLGCAVFRRICRAQPVLEPGCRRAGVKAADEGFGCDSCMIGPIFAPKPAQHPPPGRIACSFARSRHEIGSTSRPVSGTRAPFMVKSGSL